MGSLSSMAISGIFLIEIVKNEEVNHDVWCNSNVESGESDPEFQWSFSHSRLCHGIVNILVWVQSSFFVQFHLLHPNLHVIKRQTHGSSKETSHSLSQNLGLDTIWVITISILEHFRDLRICAQLTSS